MHSLNYRVSAGGTCPRRPAQVGFPQNTLGLIRRRGGGGGGFLATHGVLALLVVGFLLCCAGPKLALAAEEPGWQSLFNGTNLAGWTPVNDGVFEVKDGVIHLAKGLGWLRAEKEYGDCVLELEWRALEPQYNSGVFVRCGLEGKPFPPEGWQVNLKEKALGSLMRGSQAVVPAKTPPMPRNQWVKFRIEIRGRKITLEVDGKRAWEYEGLDRALGWVGLQAEGKAFDFRNVRIRELPPLEPGK